MFDGIQATYQKETAAGHDVYIFFLSGDFTSRCVNHPYTLITALPTHIIVSFPIPIPRMPPFLWEPCWIK